jgi:phosphatidylglycerol---prolipoprotein diacylglyceryl transferase
LRAGIEETFRLNPLAWKVFLDEGPTSLGIGLFTTTQLASIPLVLVAMVMLWRIWRAPEPPSEEQSDGVSVPVPPSLNPVSSEVKA